MFANQKNAGAVDLKNAHEAALAKQHYMEKLKSALKIRSDFEPGAAFDFEAQEQKRLNKLAEKDARRKEEKSRAKQLKKDK